MPEPDFSTKRKLDAICNEFEDQWSNEQPCDIANFLNRIEVKHQDDLARQLIEVDVELRLKHEQTISESDYKELGQLAVEWVKSLLITRDRSLDQPFQEASQVFRSTAPFNSTSVDPKIIGPYKLLQQIGEGGMGTVWMAEQEKPVRRRVALKLIKGAMADKQVIARFEAERQALAMMDHQNIAKVLDAGTTPDGNPYFVMELIQGIPINEYCDRNKLTPNERLQLFVPVCKAIQHAHQKGVIHRDLKPSNVLVQMYDGEAIAKVIDFGLAKALQHQTKLTDKTMFTEFGQVVGTLQYMSPEQATMDAMAVDTRTDIYSLGVMLYELLAGSTPIEKETLQNNALLKVLDVIREIVPPKPSHRLSSSGEKLSTISELRQIHASKLQQILRGELDWIVMKALEKDRTRRYESASDFAQDISNYLGGDTVLARPPSTLYQLRKFARKNKGLVASIMAIGVVLIMGVGVSSWFGYKTNLARIEADQKTIEVIDEKNRADLEAQNAKVKEKEATDARDALESQRTESVKRLARSNYHVAVARIKENRLNEAEDYLNKVPHRYRHIEWSLANRKMHGSGVTFFGHADEVTSVCFSPDGSQIVSGSDEGMIKLWDATTGEMLKSVSGYFRRDGTSVCFDAHGSEVPPRNNDGHFWNVKEDCFRADGTQIVCGDYDGRIFLLDKKTRNVLKALDGHSRQVTSVCFSPDRSIIASTSFDNTIKFWDTNTWKVVRTFKGNAEIGSTSLVDRSAVLCARFSPDGSWIASGNLDHTIDLWNAKTGEKLRTYRGHTDEVNCLCFSPDGSRIASGGKDNTIKLWDISLGDEHVALRDRQAEVVCFNLNGQQIASGGRDGTIKLWDTITGEVAKTFQAHNSPVHSISFSADGSRIASTGSWGDDTIKLWNAKTGKLERILEEHATNLGSISLNPNGLLIASEGEKGTIKLLNSTTGELERTFQRQNENVVIVMPNNTKKTVASIGFTSDGSRIYSTCNDGKINFTDVVSGIDLGAKQIPDKSTKKFKLSPDGSKIAYCDGAMVILWDVFLEKKLNALKGHTGDVLSICFSPDGSRLVSGGSDTMLKLWDVDTGEELATYQVNNSYIGFVCFDVDGSRIAAITPRRIMFWHVENRSEYKRMTGSARVLCAIFNARNMKAVSGDASGQIRLWDTNTAELLAAFEVHGDQDVRNVLLSPDCQRIVSERSDGVLNLWNVETGEELDAFCKGIRKAEPESFREPMRKPFPPQILPAPPSPAPPSPAPPSPAPNPAWLPAAPEQITSLRFSPDSSLIATGSNNGLIRMWSSISGKEIWKFKGHPDEVSSISFSRERQVFYSHSEKINLIWDVKTAEHSEGNKPNKSTLVESRPPIESQFLIVPSGDDVLLVDQKFKNTPREKTIRKLKARLKPIWHVEQARIAEKSNDWFAVTFHLAWVMKKEPEKASSYDQLHMAYERLKSDHAKQKKTPLMLSNSNIKKMLSIPRGKFSITLDSARQTNATIWEKAIDNHWSGERLSIIDLVQIRNISVQHPTGNHFHTLAATEYRFDNYEAAILAATKSVQLRPTKQKLSGTHTIDLALLAMSYFKLGNAEKANDFIEQIRKVMASDMYVDGNDFQYFLKELNQLIGEQKKEGIEDNK